MAQYTYANNRDLQAIAQDLLPISWGSDPLFNQFFPTRYKDVETLIWEQEDNFTGLMGPRTPDAGFNKVDNLGRSEFIVRPGYFGDQKTLMEEQLNQGRKLGTFGETVDVDELVQRDEVYLIQRGYNRVRSMCWGLVTTGAYSITGAGGVKYYQDAFSFQTYTATIPWSTTATATPLQDLRNAQQLSLGHSVRFDASAIVFVNRKQYNYLLANTNANDLGGRRVYGASGPTPLSSDQLDQILLSQDLPKIVPYDEGYFPDSIGGAAQAFTKFIADGTGVLMGMRSDGGDIGNFTMTRNSNNFAPETNGPPRVLDMGPGGQGAAQLYVDVETHKNPIRVVTTVGFNGAPVMFFPSAIVRLVNI